MLLFRMYVHYNTSFNYFLYFLFSYEKYEKNTLYVTYYLFSDYPYYYFHEIEYTSTKYHMANKINTTY